MTATVGDRDISMRLVLHSIDNIQAFLPKIPYLGICCYIPNVTLLL